MKQDEVTAKMVLCYDTSGSGNAFIVDVFTNNCSLERSHGTTLIPLGMHWLDLFADVVWPTMVAGIAIGVALCAASSYCRDALLSPIFL